MKNLKNKTFSICLTNHVMREGKKTKAHFLISSLGTELGQYTGHTIEDIYSIIFDILRPFIELKRVRVRRTTYSVPFPTNLSRQQHLVAQWLLETVRKDARKLSFNEKLRDELIRVLLRKGETIEKKKDLYKRAEKSRSFMHYRWY